MHGRATVRSVEGVVQRRKDQLDEGRRGKGINATMLGSSTVAEGRRFLSGHKLPHPWKTAVAFDAVATSPTNLIM
jgi:hypothetical protein